MLSRRFGAALQGAMLITLLGVSYQSALAVTPPFDSGGNGSTARLLDDADRASYHGRYSEAIADATRAIEIAPAFGRAYYARALFYMDAGRYAEAAADFDHVAAMHPDDFTVAFYKARLLLRRGDPAAALAQIKIVTTMPVLFYWRNPHEAGINEVSGGNPFTATGHAPADIYAFASVVEEALHKDDASVGDMQRMLQIEKDHPEHVLADYCWESALAGLLDSAELTCQQSIEDNSHDIGQYDSLGFVHLRMRAWAKAIADYNKALDNRSDLTTSLYGRGVAKRATGDVAGGNADIAAATRGEPDIANIMKRLGAPTA